MEVIHGYERITEWKHYHSVSFARVCKDGKTFAIYKYQDPVMPLNNGVFDERTYNIAAKRFQEFVHNRTNFNQTLRKVAEGRLILPVEEFVKDNHYMEVWEVLEGVVPSDKLEDVLVSLSPDIKKLLMLMMSGVLASVHSLGIVHGNVTIESFLLIKNEGGQYVTKLTGFDDCYYKGAPSECVLGDIRYFSPELATYSDEEDDKESLKHTITEKTDIFALGLVFHRYLTGEFPEAVSLTERLQKRKDAGKPVYCWSVLLNGCELKVSDAVPANYKVLIEDMLNKDPAKRPTALDVLRRLKFGG